MPNLYWPRLGDSRRRQDGLRRREWARAERDARTTLLISHGKCLDGVGSAIVTLRALGRDNVGVAFAQPDDMAAILKSYASVAGRGRTLMVADLSLQKEEFAAVIAACAKLRRNGWILEWRDHHHKQWEGLALKRLTQYLEVLEVNRDASESGASLQQKALAPHDPFLRKLAETVRDRDLWVNRLPDSEALEFALTAMGARRFVDHFLATRPSDPLVDATISKAARVERARQASVLARLLDGTRIYGEGRGRVGIVYGWLPKNTGLHEVLSEKGCAVAINVRPNGKVSLRSRRNAPVCHRIAQAFHGGGHPNASGADLRLRGAARAWYVLRKGRVPIVDRLAEVAVAELQNEADKET